MPVAVTVVKMIGRGVVKVHRQLDQTQTEDAGIEIDIRLRMACDCRHMMNARNVVLHTTYPCAITLMPARLKSLHTSRNLFPKWQIILPLSAQCSKDISARKAKNAPESLTNSISFGVADGVTNRLTSQTRSKAARAFAGKTASSMPATITTTENTVIPSVGVLGSVSLVAGNVWIVARPVSTR